MSPLASELNQFHFHYGPDLPFEDDLFFDPLDPDTDGDNVTDGKEVNGYDLVWMETFPDGSVKDHKMRSIHTNPLDPTNNLRDTDHDGMPDYYEVHYTEFYPYIVNWANDRYRQNPHEFNASEYLNNQFNPFVKENIPPMLLTMSVETKTEDVYTWVGIPGTNIGKWIWSGWNTYTDIRAKIYDVGGFSSVKISKLGGHTVTFSSLHNGWYNTTMDVGFWESLGEYTIRLEAKDNAGNELTYDYTVKGLFAGVLDFIKDIWNAITPTLSKAWDAVKSAVDFIVDFIVNILKAVFDMFIEIISNLFRDVICEIMTMISSGLTNNTIQYSKITMPSVESYDSLYFNADSMVSVMGLMAPKVTMLAASDASMRAAELGVTVYGGGGLLSLVKEKISEMDSTILRNKILVPVIVSTGISVGSSTIDFMGLVSSIINGGEPDEAAEVLGTSLSLSEKTIDMLKSIFKVVDASINLLSLSALKAYGWGLALSLLGLVIASVSAITHLSGWPLVIADIVLLALSIIGLIKAYTAKKSTELKVVDALTPITTNLELTAAVISVVVGLIKTVYDGYQALHNTGG